MISQAYPSPKQKTSFAFVHVRAKIYTKFNNKTLIFVPSFDSKQYNFEGIKVYRGPYPVLSYLLIDFDPDIIVVHAPTLSMTRNLLKILEKSNFIVWIHGGEALIQTFHNYFAPWNIEARIKNLMVSPLKVIVTGRFITKSWAVVYCSKWMKRVGEIYTLTKHKRAYVIPNPIDTNLFRYSEKNNEQKKRGISARNLYWKYGLDIAIKAYSKLEGTDLTILGTGPLEYYLNKLAQKYQSPVSLINKRIAHHEMPQFLSKFGYFIAPSRTEGQGVAMCEAMACGLPVIATKVGGIPEFVNHGINGLLVSPENPRELRKAIKSLLADDSLYDKLSRKAVEFVQNKLSHDSIYKKDHALFKMCQEQNP